MTWNFTNKFHLNKILLRPTFIEIALSVNDLLHFLCFSQFQTEDRLIIYRRAHNFWPINPIFMKLSQMIYFISLYKFAKFQTILIFETDFTDQSLKTRCGPTWRHKNLKLHEIVFCYMGNMHVQFHQNSNNSFWIIKIFLILGSVPFWSVKCTCVRKKIGNHAYFLSKSINFPKMYKDCFEQKNRTELFLVTIQTALLF